MTDKLTTICYVGNAKIMSVNLYGQIFSRIKELDQQERSLITHHAQRACIELEEISQILNKEDI